MLVLGKENCNQCSIVKKILEDRNIKFEYLLLDNSNPEHQTALKLGSEANQKNFPLIIKDGKIISLQEVLHVYKNNI